MRAFEFKVPKNKLVIFDIDDTLLHTTAKIRVIDAETGRPLHSLTNQQFNNYKLKDGEKFDFGEFQNAAKFEEESVPIGPMLDMLRSDLAAGHDVVMLTARSDFDDQKAVWRTFKRHGIDINKDVHLYRAGNLPGDDSPAFKKAVHVNRWLKTGKYNHVTMYDDSEKNLTVFKSLQKNFPGVDFEAQHVSPEGVTKQIEEGVSAKTKKDFIEMFVKFLPLAIKILKLTSLPKFKFQDKIEQGEQPSFGMYVNKEKTLYVALLSRHPNDILRTVAHELVHFKQDEENRLGQYSGDTGSPEENDANARAGIIMRHFNKLHPEYLGVKPIILEKWSVKYKRSINCTNPKGFSQRAHCQGRKKNESTGDRGDIPTGPGEQLIPFPQGTTMVDVSDVYDWYKLGMVISDLDDANPDMFGKGAPSTVIAFGSEQEEHKLLPYLKKLGLKLHDIDQPSDVKKVIPAKTLIQKMENVSKESGVSIEEKRKKKIKHAAYGPGPYGWYGYDADYSSDFGGDGGGIEENFADGKNSGRKGLSKRVGVDCSQPESKLRSIAKKSSGEKQRMAHWCANMKSGKN